MRQTTLSLIIFSFMLGFIAPACGFMWGGKYSIVEICTSQGIEQRVVANTTDSTQSDHKLASDKCEFCFQNMNLGSYLINTQDNINFHFDIKTKLSFTHQNNVASSSPTIYLARGPPVLS